MRAALISARGVGVEGLGDVLHVADDHPRPKIRPRSDDVIVRVLATSLAPGDVRVLSGRTSWVQSPPSVPYIPGSDICGVVVEAGAKSTFKEGDEVIAMFEGKGPWDGLVELKRCKATHTVRKPKGMTPVEACTLPSSALTAMRAADLVKKGDRVVILGAGGGVGLSLVQLCKHRGASLVVASTQAAGLAADLGADLVVDYTRQDWTALPELRDAPADIVFDLALEPNTWDVVCKSGAVKNREAGGKYVSSGAPGDPHPKVQNPVDMLGLMGKIVKLMLRAQLNPSAPAYTMLEGLDQRDLGRLVDLAEAGAFRPCLAKGSPLPFTKEGIVQGYEQQASRHPRGKVVIQIAP